jgi:Protein of unknown function (DUF3738)/Clp amino terminal domain, pathogenicity island component
MFERYNEQARRSLFFALHEANLSRSDAIEPEHLLLGLLKERNALVAQMLDTANATAEGLRRSIYARLGASTSPSDTLGEKPFSRNVKHVLQYALEEADRLLHDPIGPEHLLLGLLRLEQGLAWDILSENRVALTPVREALVMHVSGTTPPEIAWMFPRQNSDLAHSGEVYFMTAVDGPHSGRRTASDDDGFGPFVSTSSVGFSTRTEEGLNRSLHSIGPISMSAASLPELAAALEDFLGGTVIDMTGLRGLFDIELHGEYNNPEALIAALRDQLGLVLTRD